MLEAEIPLFKLIRIEPKYAGGLGFGQSRKLTKLSF